MILHEKTKAAGKEKESREKETIVFHKKSG